MLILHLKMYHMYVLKYNIAFAVGCQGCLWPSPERCLAEILPFILTLHLLY